MGHKFKRLLRDPLHFVFKVLNIFPFYCLYKSSFLTKSGWVNSFTTGSAIDSNGAPIPWMTYPVLNFLENRVRGDMVVFEYSCGNSTLWWAKKVKYLVSCEHDKSWYQKMKQKIPQNVDLFHVDLEYGGKYSSEILKYDQMFDIIVIDGRDRVNCIKNSLLAIKSDGVFIWDNSDRECYEEGFNYLISNGYKKIDFYGIGPINLDSWCTSVFYKNDNCLRI